jgi:hypothetical protein
VSSVLRTLRPFVPSLSAFRQLQELALLLLLPLGRGRRGGRRGSRGTGRRHGALRGEDRVRARVQGARHVAGGLRAHGAGSGGGGDAGADVVPHGVRHRAAVQGRQDHGVAAHDHPDGGADRDADGPGRGGSVVLVQHLLDAGPRGGRHCARQRGGVRVEGRDAAGVLVVHGEGAGLGPRRWAGSDRGRRRGRDIADPRGREGGDRVRQGRDPAGPGVDDECRVQDRADHPEVGADLGCVSVFFFRGREGYACVVVPG